MLLVATLATLLGQIYWNYAFNFEFGSDRSYDLLT